MAEREGIDAGIVKGGTLEIARNPAQAGRLAAALAEERDWGNDGVVGLTTAEAAQRIRFADVVSAYYTPHCARIQPARLARGLADVVERLGVPIYERIAGRPHRARPRHRPRWAPSPPRSCCAPPRASRPALPGLRRRWLPMNSSMIATDPIPEPLWSDIGWDGRETVGDTAHGFFYAQRTVDDRIAIGGRSVPYRYASRTDVDGRVPARTIRHLSAVLHDVLPQVRDVPIAHGWCGVLAVPRDWEATVASTGRRASAKRAATSGTASRRPTSRAARWPTSCSTGTRRCTELPWVGHRSRQWEPEPLRWLGVRGLYVAYKLADRHEAGGRATTSPIAKVADRITGRP